MTQTPPSVFARRTPRWVQAISIPSSYWVRLFERVRASVYRRPGFEVFSIQLPPSYSTTPSGVLWDGEVGFRGGTDTGWSSGNRIVQLVCYRERGCKRRSRRPGDSNRGIPTARSQSSSTGSQTESSSMRRSCDLAAGGVSSSMKRSCVPIPRRANKFAGYVLHKVGLRRLRKVSVDQSCID